MSARTILARGPRAAESELLRAVADDAALVRAAPERCTAPLRIVVPSTALREHVLTRIAQTHGATLGVSVQTIHALTREVGERCGMSPPRGAALLAHLVERAARAENVLVGHFAALEEGARSVAATVRDLFDAGFELAHAEAIADLLRAETHGSERELALAVVRVAAAVRRAAATQGVSFADEYGRQVARSIADGSILPARAIWVHGFADATGAVLDVLRALPRAAPTTVVVDLPADPFSPAEEDRGGRFARAFLQRLGDAANGEPARAEDGEWIVRSAGDPRAELRAVAADILAAADAGVPFEECMLVVRTAAARRRELRAVFAAAAVPFSAPGMTASVHPRERRAAAAVDVFVRGAEAPGDRLLDALAPEQGGELARRASEVRLALRALGLLRLVDLVEFDFAPFLREDAYELPNARAAAAARDDDDDDGDDAEGAEDEDAAERAGEGPERRASPAAEGSARTVSGTLLRAFLELAREALAASATEPLEEADSTTAFARFRDLFNGWRRSLDPTIPTDDPLEAALEERVAALAGFATGPSERAAGLVAALDESVWDELAPGGGGVRVFEALAARGLTAARTYLVAVERDLFPRRVREDPLLRDAVRFRLQALLPDLAAKSAGHDEERWLFASLAASAPRVRVSHAEEDGRGGKRQASTLVRRRTDEAQTRASEVVERRVLPWRERARGAALAGDREGAFAHLAAGEDDAAVGDALQTHFARFESPSRTPGLPELCGRVGAAALLARRTAELSLTHLEALARCPWQAFLERTLGLQALPDPALELPALEPHLVGNVVHEVIETLAREALGANADRRPLAAALEQPGAPFALPAAADLTACARAAASRVLRAAGIAWSGLGEPLASMAVVHLEALRVLLAAPQLAGARVLTVEVDGTCTLAAEGAAVRFRADFAAVVGERRLLVDWKTGKPLSSAKQAETRRKHFLAAVADGRHLQAGGYLRALRELGVHDAGAAYVFLRADLAAETAIQTIASDDADEAAFERAFAAVAALGRTALAHGALPPRLFAGKDRTEPATCGRCTVRDACVRGDSGLRRRLLAFASASPGEESLESAAQALLLLRAGEPAEDGA